MKIGLAILHFALIFYCVFSLGRKWNILFNKLFWGSFLIRLLTAISLGLIYRYYYSAGDTWLFFEDAKFFSGLARTDFISYLKALIDFSENQTLLSELVNQDLRSIFFIKIISVICLLSLDNYWVCAGYISLLAFISSWALHRKVVSIVPDSSNASMLAFLFFPSVIFWSSGLEKESIAMSGIYFLAIGFLSLMSFKKAGNLFWWFLIPVCFVVWSLKYYWAIIFIISVLTAFVSRLLNSKFIIIRKYLIGTWIILFFGMGILLSFTHPNFYPHRFLEVIVSNNNEFNAISDSKNLIHYFELNQTWLSIMINSPWALLSGLFRPIIGEGRGALGWFASIENLFVLFLFIGALSNIKKAFSSRDHIILLTTISYCVVLCVFLALSTPNFGTLSRYRIGFLPFFVFLLAYQNPAFLWLCEKIGLKNL